MGSNWLKSFSVLRTKLVPKHDVHIILHDNRSVSRFLSNRSETNNCFISLGTNTIHSKVFAYHYNWNLSDSFFKQMHYKYNISLNYPMTPCSLLPVMQFLYLKYILMRTHKRLNCASRVYGFDWLIKRSVLMAENGEETQDCWSADTDWFTVIRFLVPIK